VDGIRLPPAYVIRDFVAIKPNTIRATRISIDTVVSTAPAFPSRTLMTG
jgi:hypothetical protein